MSGTTPKYLILLADEGFSRDGSLTMSKLIDTDYYVIYYTEGAYSDRIEMTYHIKKFSDFLSQSIKEKGWFSNYKEICEYVKGLCQTHDIEIDCEISDYLKK